MNSTIKSLRFLSLLIPLTLGIAVPSWGQEGRRAPGLTSVEIEVLDPATGSVRGTLSPEDTLELESGSTVDLRLRGILPGGRSVYPETSFRLVSRSSDLSLRPVGDEQGRWIRVITDRDERMKRPSTVVLSYRARSVRVGERGAPASGRLSVRILPPQPEVRITGYEIERFDLETGARQGILDEGDTLELSPGSPVELRLVALTSDGESFYPAARFFVEKGAGFLEASDRNRRTGGTTIRALDTIEIVPEELELIFGLIEEHALADGVKRHGSVPVRVLSASGATSPSAMATLLYRSILLRDPEPASHASLTDRIAAGGLTAVIDAAIEMAGSSESRSMTTERRANDRDRLVALYDGLHGIGQEEAPPADWTRHASLISRARIELVVEDLVRHPRFRQYHGYEDVSAPGVRRRR